MDRLSMTLKLNGLAYGALLVCALSASACGDPSCPAGSVSTNGRCEPAAQGCDEGEVKDDAGECVDDSPSPIEDAGPDGDVGSDDAAVDETVDRGDSSVSDAAEPDMRCAAVDCGDHGACKVVNDEVLCECTDGFDGDLCDECESGLALGDGECVPLCEAESAPDCGDHGECRISDGNPSCRCEHPFTGDECADCAEGFALQSDGSCEPDCGECGAHSFCNEELMTPSCECVAGYEGSGSGCTWVGDGVTGGIVDRDLDVPESWSYEYLSIADGFAEFENAMVGAVCKLGRIEQSIRMPAWEDAEPLVLEMDARATCTNTDPAACPALLVDFGDTVTRVPMAGGPAPVNGKLTVCLGKAVYKEEILLRVRPGLATTMGTATACSAPWPSVQRIGIRPANPGECPAEGLSLGSLNSTAGWTIRGSATISGNKLTVSGANGQASTLVSVPVNGGVALRVTTSTPANTVVLLDGIWFQKGTHASTTNICFPKWTFGSVHQIGFGMVGSATEVTALTVQADASCVSGNFDAGFERPLGTGSWTPFFPVATVEMSSSAHSPSRVWRAENSFSSALDALLLMPGYGDENRRPILSVWTRIQGANMEGTLAFTGAGLSNYSVETTSQTFGRSVACVGEEWAGQPAFMVATGSASMTDGSVNTATLWVDDMGPDTLDASACN